MDRAQKRETTAPDKGTESVARRLEHRDVLIDPFTPPPRESLPVLAARSTVDREAGERVDDLAKAESDTLCIADEGNPVKHLSMEAALTRIVPSSMEWAVALVTANWAG